ncbi:hypothetical protein RRG08_014219 [Elysia crispata]|uniref:Uncharacterized protein n=1 Tax=Elysia crispata TaxID=231223 RepID=A0AAE0XEE3_9GAST|nr:hypothetical protein RRG08_014219 [Elysia crispata]
MRTATATMTLTNLSVCATWQSVLQARCDTDSSLTRDLPEIPTSAILLNCYHSGRADNDYHNRSSCQQKTKANRRFPRAASVAVPTSLSERNRELNGKFQLSVLQWQGRLHPPASDRSNYQLTQLLGRHFKSRPTATRLAVRLHATFKVVLTSGVGDKMDTERLSQNKLFHFPACFYQAPMRALFCARRENWMFPLIGHWVMRMRSSDRKMLISVCSCATLVSVQNNFPKLGIRALLSGAVASNLGGMNLADNHALKTLLQPQGFPASGPD